MPRRQKQSADTRRRLSREAARRKRRINRLNTAEQDQNTIPWAVKQENIDYDEFQDMETGAVEYENIADNIAGALVDESAEETVLPCFTRNDYLDAGGENPSLSENEFSYTANFPNGQEIENIVNVVKIEPLECDGTDSLDGGQDSEYAGQDSEFSEWDEPDKDPLDDSALSDHQNIVQVKVERVEEDEYEHLCPICGARFPSERDLEFHSAFHKSPYKIRKTPKIRKKKKKTIGGRSKKSKSQSVVRGEKTAVSADTNQVDSLNSNQNCSSRLTRSGQALNSVSEVSESKKKVSKDDAICSYCGADFGCPSRLRDHIRKHTGERPYRCNTCGKKFVTLPVLRRHAREHNEHKPYSCPICKKCFAAESNLLQHKRLHNRKNTVLCTFCGKAYRNQADLTVHERSHTGERPFLCNVCGKSFVTRVVLKRHERVHAEDKPFSCPVCEKAFAAEVDVRGHMRSHPVKDLPLKCYICSNDCSTVEELSAHLETHNVKRKTLQCDICGLSQRNASELDIHRRRHTGEKPFHCHCGKSFVSNVVLRKHMRRHSDDKPYQCEVCPKKFAAMADMKSHLRSHPAKKIQEGILRFNLELLGHNIQEEGGNA